MAQPQQNPDLHGNVPDDCPVALLLIDVINDLEFGDGERTLPHALPMAAQIRRLKERAEALGIPAIYVNDNFGRWRSDFKALIQHCLTQPVRGRPLARLLTPNECDYFVLKPKHSGFYATSLELLLQYLRARTLILTGLATDICVQFTANDAYMRDYRLVVPADCVASRSASASRRALATMKHLLDADITCSEELDLEQLLAR